MYQRFAFENLSPEQQSQTIIKQLRQQQQREMLEQQINDKKRYDQQKQLEAGNMVRKSHNIVNEASNNAVVNNSYLRNIPSCGTIDCTIAPVVLSPLRSQIPRQGSDKHLVSSSNIDAKVLHRVFSTLREKVRADSINSLNFANLPPPLRSQQLTFDEKAL